MSEQGWKKIVQLSDVEALIAQRLPGWPRSGSGRQAIAYFHALVETGIRAGDIPAWSWDASLTGAVYAPADALMAYARRAGLDQRGGALSRLFNGDLYTPMVTALAECQDMTDVIQAGYLKPYQAKKPGKPAGPGPAA